MLDGMQQSIPYSHRLIIERGVIARAYTYRLI